MLTLLWDVAKGWSLGNLEQYGVEAITLTTHAQPRQANQLRAWLPFP